VSHNEQSRPVRRKRARVRFQHHEAVLERRRESRGSEVAHRELHGWRHAIAVQARRRDHSEFGCTRRGSRSAKRRGADRPISTKHRRPPKRIRARPEYVGAHRMGALRGPLPCRSSAAPMTEGIGSRWVGLCRPVDQVQSAMGRRILVKILRPICAIATRRFRSGVSGGGRERTGRHPVRRQNIVRQRAPSRLGTPRSISRPAAGGDRRDSSRRPTACYRSPPARAAHRRLATRVIRRRGRSLQRGAGRDSRTVPSSSKDTDRARPSRELMSRRRRLRIDARDCGCSRR